jgi:hypothetical protein
MKESSLIMIKPSNLCLDNVYNYIVDELKNNDLVIKRDYIQLISEYQFCNMWPWLKQDIILFYTHEELYKVKPRLLEIYGENAISKVAKLKRDVRLKYANSLFKNCIHAPTDEQEYRNNIEIIKEDKENNILSFPNLPYLSYKKLNEELCRQLAKIIVDINLYTMIPYVSRYNNCQSKYRCYLVDGCPQLFTHYVCFICDYLPHYDFNDAVIITSILIVNKEICIYAGDDDTYIKSLVSNGQKHNIKIKCHRVE